MAAKIESYRFGQIRIAGQTYAKDVIITPDRIISNWWREQGHALSIDDLQELLSTPPQVLIIGTGAHGRMQVPHETLHQLESNNIQTLVLESEQACQRYNDLCDIQAVALAIHLTC